MQGYLPGFDLMDANCPEGTETTKQRSTVGIPCQDATIDSRPVQAALPSFGFLDTPVEVTSRTYPDRTRLPDPYLIAEFHRRVQARNEVRSAIQYRWQLLNILKLASRLSGRSISIEEFLGDEVVLGQTLSCPTTADGSREVSSWLASQRRSVLRSFIELMAPDLRESGIEDAGKLLTQALRNVASPVGGGYRLPVGVPRGRGGAVPELEEIAAISEELSSKREWRGLRNLLILGLLSSRGQRIGGLLQVEGRNLHRLPDGRYRIILRAKSAHEPYELAVPSDLVGILESYIASFNLWAKASGLPDRIGIGTPETFWRNDAGGKLTYHAWTQELKEACIAAGMPGYTSHAFRRSFATHGSLVALRSIVATAGNWTSTRRMDDHYAQPSLVRVRLQLANLGSDSQTSEAEEISVIRSPQPTGRLAG